MSALRVDLAMVERGLARSRSHAQQLVRAGGVLVDGRPARRPAQPVGPHADVMLTLAGEDEARWVGRGALKLVAALSRHPEVARAADGGRCLDVGASTGGFTQVLLLHGAREVVALDVGHDQLAPELRADPRVVERSGTNARDVRPGDVGRFDVVVCDVSFISVTLLLPVMAALLLPMAHVVVLVKPQFEVGREEIGDGVVTDPRARARAVGEVARAAMEAGLAVCALDRSPVEGTHGNLEYLLWLRSPGAAASVLTGDVLAARIRAVCGTRTH